MMTATDLWADPELKFAPLQTNANPRSRILVVDDEPLIRVLMARVLRSRGYEVDLAEDGEDAWQALHADFSYDLLVTDNNMPRMTGVELLKKLHAARLTLPVVLISAVMPTDDLHWHPWLKIDATLSKPFTGDELAGAVSNTLRLNQELEAKAHA